MVMGSMVNALVKKKIELLMYNCSMLTVIVDGNVALPVIFRVKD